MIVNEENEKDSIEKMYDMYTKKKFKRGSKKEQIDIKKDEVEKETDRRLLRGGRKPNKK